MSGHRGDRKQKTEEGYPPNWIHCMIHLNPETGEMHSDGNHDIRKWIQDLLSEKEIEISELNNWIDDLQSGMYINCVYCGHRYPPGTNAVKRKVLYEHIKVCPKHPLSKAEIQIKELTVQIKEFRSKLRSVCLHHSHTHNEDWPDGGGIVVCDDCGMSKYVWEQGETEWTWIKNIPEARKELKEAMRKL